MGSSTSKAAAKASKLSAANTARKYPTRSPPLSSPRTNVAPPPPSTTVGPSVHPPPQATESRDRAVETDAQDPTLDNPGLRARLQELGPVQPNPTFSNSSTFNQRPRLHNPANPHIEKQTSSPRSQQSSHDPSLSSSFIPSASNPAQTIFPSQSQSLAQGGRINPAVSLLTARYRLAEEAEREFTSIGKTGGEGRQFLDVVTLRKVLELRDEKGVNGGEIERRLELRKGVVRRLGRRGVVGVAQ